MSNFLLLFFKLTVSPAYIIISYDSCKGLRLMLLSKCEVLDFTRSATPADFPHVFPPMA